MVEPLKDELLSAYLDDALSVADRDRVERHLAVNPEDRQLVDELRVLRESLQSLPRHELPAAFRDKVLRQAERAMLTQPVEAPVAAQANPPRRPKWLPVGGYRTLAWPAAVLAVAIMLMVVYHEGPDKTRDVAQVAKPRVGAAEGEGGSRRTPPEIRARSADESRNETTASSRLQEDLAELVAQPTGKAPVASRPVASPRPAEHEDHRPSKQGPGGTHQAAEQFAFGKVDSPDEASLDGAAVDSHEATPSPTDQPLGRQRRVMQTGRGMLLVQVEIRRKAAEAHAFEKLLERQQITPQQQIAFQQQVALQLRLEGLATTAGDTQRARSRGQLGLRAKKSAGRGANRLERLDRDEASGQVPEGVEVFFAEATESQVQAALEDLDKRIDEFPDFAVRPDPSQPRQARFGAIQRGRQLGESQRYFADWDGRKKTKLKASDSGSEPGPFGGEEDEGLTTRSAGNGGVSALAAQSAEEQEGVKAKAPSGVPSGPLSKAAVAQDDDDAIETGTDLAKRQANRSSQAYGEPAVQAKRRARAPSRGGYGYRGAGQKLLEADGQSRDSRLLGQQVAPPMASAPAAQAGPSQASSGRGYRGKPPAAEEARPLQIVFLLRVVDPEPAPTADAVPDEPK